MDVRFALGGGIAVLLLLLVLTGAVWLLYRRIRRDVRGLSQTLFHTSSLRQGVRQMEEEYASTPKSLSAATELYLPGILRDFPEFHLDEMRERAKNVLTSYLRSVSQGDASLLTEGTRELRERLQMRISQLREQGAGERYERIRIHRAEIHRYRKEKGRCSIVFQISVEYVHYLLSGETLVRGNRERLEQSKYNVEVDYIQDRELAEAKGEGGMALNCPNCGAPLPGLGAQTCAYCGSPIVPFNIRVWNFASVEEVR